MGDHKLWEAFSQTNDPQLKEQLVLQYLGLVKYLAGRLIVNASSTMTQEDLEGYGVIGLLDAIGKYDHGLGTPFKNYAYTRIRGSMMDEIRKQNWVPRSKWQKFSQLRTAQEKLRRLGQKPDEQALATAMGLDHAKLRQLVSEYQQAFPLSLDEGAGVENQGALMNVLGDPNSPDPLDLVVQNSEKECLIQAIEGLPERDQLVLALYYQEELTLKEIGQILELTESRVCQLHAGALKKLRGILRGRVKIDATRKEGGRL